MRKRVSEHPEEWNEQFKVAEIPWVSNNQLAIFTGMYQSGFFVLTLHICTLSNVSLYKGPKWFYFFIVGNMPPSIGKTWHKSLIGRFKKNEPSVIRARSKSTRQWRISSSPNWECLTNLSTCVTYSNRTPSKIHHGSNRYKRWQTWHQVRYDSLWNTWSNLKLCCNS